jgi:hypothetical protein
MKNVMRQKVPFLVGFRSKPFARDCRNVIVKVSGSD